MKDKLKKRVRGAKFQAVAQGKVWTFRWNPRTQRLEGRQRYSHISYSMSPDQLADALCGQFSLFAANVAPVKHETAS